MSFLGSLSLTSARTLAVFAALAALSDRPLSGDKLGHCSVSEAVDSDEHRGENSHAE